MAYFSGNAIYIRNSMQITSNSTTICGGATIYNNTFTNNIGMKAHNGGAISITCYYVTSSAQ